MTRPWWTNDLKPTKSPNGGLFWPIAITESHVTNDNALVMDPPFRSDGLDYLFMSCPQKESVARVGHHTKTSALVWKYGQHFVLDIVASELQVLA